MKNNCIQRMHKMHKIYKNVGKRRDVVAVVSDARVKNEARCNN
jgi:ribosome biogenesis GTPase A